MICKISSSIGFVTLTENGILIIDLISIYSKFSKISTKIIKNLATTSKHYYGTGAVLYMLISFNLHSNTSLHVRKQTENG